MFVTRNNLFQCRACEMEFPTAEKILVRRVNY